jgi:hypothetical protein
VIGHVIDAATGAPVPNARVSLAVRRVGSPVVLSGADGGFSMPIAPGVHSIAASKTGYVSGQVAWMEASWNASTRFTTSGAFGRRPKYSGSFASIASR